MNDNSKLFDCGDYDDEKFDVILIVTGSRSIVDSETFDVKMNALCRNLNTESVLMISGNAVGVDTLAATYANKSNIKYRQFKADWSLGKGAGFIRDSLMRDWAKEHAYNVYIVYLWDGFSKGTIAMVKACEKLGFGAIRF